MISVKIWEKIILLFILFQVLVDSFQGFISLKLGLNVTISQPYKLLLVGLCIIYLYSIGKKFSYLLFAATYGLTFITIHLFSNVASGVLHDMSEYIKLLTTPIVFYTIACFRYNNPFKYTHKWIVIMLLTFSANIIISILGYGTYSYGDYGYKGFFYAANALSGSLCIMASLFLTLNLQRNQIFYIVATVMCVTIALAIGTKSGLLSVVLLFLILPVFNGFIRRFSLFYLLVLLILSLSFFWLIPYIENTGAIERILYFYETGGLMRAILSDRNIFLSDLMSAFIQSDILTLLFGMGFGVLNEFEKPLSEIDPADIILIFGMLGFLVYFLFISNVIYRLFMLKRIGFNYGVVELYVNNAIVVTIVLFSMSCIAGHIAFNGMTTSYWGFVVALPFWMINYLENSRQCTDV